MHVYGLGELRKLNLMCIYMHACVTNTSGFTDCCMPALHILHNNMYICTECNFKRLHCSDDKSDDGCWLICTCVHKLTNPVDRSLSCMYTQYYQVLIIMVSYNYLSAIQKPYKSYSGWKSCSNKRCRYIHPTLCVCTIMSHDPVRTMGYIYI